ncbi:MAG: hypothetical protein CMI27_01050 [Opitutae bacterium]|nr:hypothetical protein [Opitutae bacterium]
MKFLKIKVLPSRNYLNELITAKIFFPIFIPPLPMKSFTGSAFILFLFPLLLASAASPPRLSCPEELKPLVTKYLEMNPSESLEETKNGLRKHLVEAGYSFAQVFAVKTAGVSTIEVKTGFMGKTNLKGNQFLSNESILQSLNWSTGEPFNFGSFQSNSARLNANRFITVDSKLKPVRGYDGEIQVNADLSVVDKYPIGYSFNISNDGTEQSSGWRAKAGFELWEAIAPNDRLSMSYTLDPKNSSQLSSYFGTYQFGSAGFRQTIFAGYSDSDYENVVSSVNMNIAGDGFFAGYSALYELSSDGLGLSFGFNYLDLSNQVEIFGHSFSEQDLSLFLPRIGLQGSFNNPSSLQGKSYWSLGVVSDLSTSDNSELSVQNPAISKGFWVPQFSFALLEPASILGLKGGVKLKLDGQLAEEALPLSLKKSLGGASTIRGYREREAYGDSGYSINLEYAFASEETNIFGWEGDLQKVVFYDAGYLNSTNSISSIDDSTGMQSFGVGLVGSLDQQADFSLQVGVPIENTLNTRKNQARTHFNFNYRF